MKYLTKNADIMHLYVLRDLLEANGIPAVIKGENTARMISPFLMSEPTLWVYLDEQAEEAEKLILDPEYEVENPIDVQEFYEITKEAAENPTQIYDTVMNWAVISGVVIGAILLVITLLGG